MNILIFILILFGALMIVAGFMLFINPALILNFIENNNNNPGLYLTAIMTRGLLGVLLIFQAGNSIHPLAVTIIGWIAVIAAICFLLMGRKNFSRLLNWIMTKITSWAKAAGIAAVIFGSYIIYAFL